MAASENATSALDSKIIAQVRVYFGCFSVGKFIFWIVVFFLALLALRMVSVHKTRREARELDEEKKDRIDGRDTTPASDTMVRCASCGVYLPKANAVMNKNGASCGNADCEYRKR
jgi:uncharacterized protein